MVNKNMILQNNHFFTFVLFFFSFVNRHTFKIKMNALRIFRIQYNYSKLLKRTYIFKINLFFNFFPFLGSLKKKLQSQQRSQTTCCPNRYGNRNALRTNHIIPEKRKPHRTVYIRRRWVRKFSLSAESTVAAPYGFMHSLDQKPASSRNEHPRRIPKQWRWRKQFVSVDRALKFAAKIVELVPFNVDEKERGEHSGRRNRSEDVRHDSINFPEDTCFSAVQLRAKQRNYGTAGRP